MIYLASPYTHPDHEVRTRRYEEISRIAAKILMTGQNLYCPIAMTHPIAQFGDLQGDWDFWQNVDTEYLGFCSELWVCTMDGWKESKGVQAEIEIMRNLGKPVKFVSPEDYS
jgi:hypothetical protein